MFTPIYKVYIQKRLLLGGAGLSKEQEEKLTTATNQKLAEVGGRDIISCWSTWSSETIQWFGISEYPNIKAVMSHTRFLEELGWLNMADTMTLLGTADAPIQDFAALLKTEQPIVKLWMVKTLRPEFYQATEEERQKAMSQQDGIYEGYGKTVLTCSSRWASEQYSGFGFDIFPDLEACQKVHQELEKIDWFRWTETDSVLGVPA